MELEIGRHTLPLSALSGKNVCLLWTLACSPDPEICIPYHHLYFFVHILGGKNAMELEIGRHTLPLFVLGGKNVCPHGPWLAMLTGTKSYHRNGGFKVTCSF